VPAQLTKIALVTIHPDHVAPSALGLVDILIVVGSEPQATLDAFASGCGDVAISLPAHEKGSRLAWLVRVGAPPLRFGGLEPAADRQRHQRKYAEGKLDEDRSFYFRGSEGRLNLRAQNLEPSHDGKRQVAVEWRSGANVMFQRHARKSSSRSRGCWVGCLGKRRLPAEGLYKGESPKGR
jgi:hypothetical protein